MTICASWRAGTEKQYNAAWRSWCVWCYVGKRNLVQSSEVTVLSYLNYLQKRGKSYSVINTHKSMIIQTSKLLGNEWCVSPSYISRFMKGLFNKIPPVPRYCSMWNVDHVIQFLRTLYPLENLSIKMLAFKTMTLVALAVAPHAQDIGIHEY